MCFAFDRTASLKITFICALSKPATGQESGIKGQMSTINRHICLPNYSLIRKGVKPQRETRLFRKHPTWSNGRPTTRTRENLRMSRNRSFLNILTSGLRETLPLRGLEGFLM